VHMLPRGKIQKSGISGRNWLRLPDNAFFFLPGILFVLVALVMILNPALIIAAVAGFLLFVGALLCFAAVKFLRFKRQVEKMAEELQAKVVVHRSDMEDFSQDNGEEDLKKILFH